jgi:hypothetical protein
MAPREFPEMFLGHGNRPAEAGKHAPLRGAALTQLKIALLDIIASLGEQPLAQSPREFLDLSPQFPDWDLARQQVLKSVSTQ